MSEPGDDTGPWSGLRANDDRSPAEGQPGDDVVARYYDLEHDGLVADAALYSELARERGGPVLELGCGTGRLLLPLSRAGHRVVGVDCSAPMLRRAEARLRAAADTRGAWQLYQADVRRLDLGERFGLVLAPLDLLGYFPEVGDQLALLEGARSHLRPGGLLALDVTFPTQSFFGQPDGLPVHQWTRQAPGGETVTKWWLRELDPARQIQHLTALYDVIGPDGVLKRWIHQLELRYYHRYELELLLERAGFRVEHVYGGYALEDLAADSPRLLIYAAQAGR